jgi:hypothetical protein
MSLFFLKTQNKHNKFQNSVKNKEEQSSISAQK